MTGTLQKSISNRGLGAASAALTLLLVLGLGAVTTPSAQAQTFATLYSFDGTDGYFPYAGLVQATDGNLYGTTGYGGADDCPGDYYGCGTVFKITPGGKLTTLYNFCAQSGCTDGYAPMAGLVQDANGNFYGTTYSGGANNSYGTVFKITPSGKLTTLHRFHRFQNYDGANPSAGLLQATDGNFYGTTLWGGHGTVFKITPGGKLTTLYNFCSQRRCRDGSYPMAGLVQATDGNFYGTTTGGGTNYRGTVFRITPSGKLTTLYSFCSKSDCTDGETPYAGLVQATDGNFYGTTLIGGANDCHGKTYGCGTVFKITPSGKLTTLYRFCSQSGCPDGGFPEANLIQATDGNF